MAPREMETRAMQQGAPADGGGLRHDAGKLRFDLLPTEWLVELAAISTVGSVKYMPRNWERGMAWSKMIGCLLRHLFLGFLSGVRFDPESGRHHLGHVAWNALALMSYDMRQIGEQDHPGTPKPLDPENKTG